MCAVPRDMTCHATFLAAEVAMEMNKKDSQHRPQDGPSNSPKVSTGCQHSVNTMM